jgi:flavin reductase (DIM6/NTAB) family NADH-FMN oxidoreductase RutF/rubredoxin
MIDIQSFFTLSYGLYIVTSGDRNSASGFIANSVFQVTSEPSVIAVSCNKDNFSHSFLSSSRKFALSVLSKDASPEIISDFGYRSGKDFDKFQGRKLIYGETGVPVVTDQCISWIECEIIDTHDLGTHVLFFGQVLSSGMLNDSAVCMTYEYYRNVIKGAAPKNAPTYVDKSLLVNEQDNGKQFSEYKCRICGYLYNEAEGDSTQGVPPGTLFSQLPENWLCPLCKTGKEDFE